MASNNPRIQNYPDLRNEQRYIADQILGIIQEYPEMGENLKSLITGHIFDENSEISKTDLKELSRLHELSQFIGSLGENFKNPQK